MIFFNINKIDEQEKLLAYLCFVSGCFVIYMLVLFLVTFYPQLFFQSTIWHHHRREFAILTMLILFIVDLLSYLFWLTINKSNRLKNCTYTLISKLCKLINTTAVHLLNYAKTKDIKTSRLLGKGYFLIFILSSVLGLRIIHLKRDIFFVVLLPTVSLMYAIGYTLSSNIRYLNEVFPQNTSETKQLSIEVLKFFGITIAGLLIMLVPPSSKIIQFLTASI